MTIQTHRVCTPPLTVTAFVDKDTDTIYLIDEATNLRVVEICAPRQTYLCNLQGIEDSNVR